LIEYFRNTAHYIHQKIRDEGFKDETDKGIYQDLPGEFSTGEIIKIAWDHYGEIEANTVKKRIVPRFIRDGLIKRIKRGKYAKTVHHVHNVHENNIDSVQNVHSVQCTGGNNGQSKHEAQAMNLHGVTWDELTDDQKDSIEFILGPKK